MGGDAETSNPIRRLTERLRELAPASQVDLLLQWALFALTKRLSPLWGREDDLWIFGARGGGDFADNAKYLYLWVAANDPSIRAVWLTKNGRLVRTLQRNGYEAYHVRSPRGIALSLRAGVVFVTQGMRDVNMACSGGAKLVQLWHGIPLKKIGWDAERGEYPLPIRCAHRYMARQMDLVTVPTEATIGPLSSGLGIDQDRFVETGYPRNDALVRRIDGERIGTDEAILENVAGRAAEGPVVLYLPTYREEGESFVDRFDVEAVGDLLAERNAHLFVKAHPYEPVESARRDHPRVHWLPPAVEPYPLLSHADALLTDYSSVYFDYLQLDRPIVFYPYDLDRYREKRGFYFEYGDVTPGPKATDAASLLASLEEAIDAVEGGEDPYEKPRARIRERFCGSPAGSAAASVYRAVRERLLDGSDSPAEEGGTIEGVASTTSSDRTI